MPVYIIDALQYYGERCWCKVLTPEQQLSQNISAPNYPYYGSILQTNHICASQHVRQNCFSEGRIDIAKCLIIQDHLFRRPRPHVTLLLAVWQLVKLLQPALQTLAGSPHSQPIALISLLPHHLHQLHHLASSSHLLMQPTVEVQIYEIAMCGCLKVCEELYFLEWRSICFYKATVLELYFREFYKT